MATPCSSARGGALPEPQRLFLEVERLSLLLAYGRFWVVQQRNLRGFAALEGFDYELNVARRQIEAQIVPREWPSVCGRSAGMHSGRVPSQFSQTLRPRERALVSAIALDGREVIEATIHGFPDFDRHLTNGHEPKLAPKRSRWEIPQRAAGAELFTNVP